MSSITANISLQQIEANTHSQPKRLRYYQKVSESNLDDSAVEAYLRSRKFMKTLVTFQQEIRSEKATHPLLKILEAGPMSYSGSIEALWIEVQRASESSVPREDQSKLQLYLYIWYCIGEEGVYPHRAKALKEFIRSRGEELSQIPELIPYFVLPYLEGNMTNSILKKVQTAEWRAEVRKLLERSLGRAEDSSEQEWVNIIKDLIEICEGLMERLQFQINDSQIGSMLTRVGQYRKVLENNLASGIKDSINGADVVRCLKGQLLKLCEVESFSVAEFDRIYHRAYQQLRKRAVEGIDKAFVSSLLEQDMLMFNGKRIPHLSSGWLTLLQTVSSYYRARKYLLGHPQIFPLLLRALGSELEEPRGGATLKRALAILKIFQGCLRSKELAMLIFSIKQFIPTVVDLILCYEPLYPLCSSADAQVFTGTLSCALAISLHRQGRMLLSSTHLMKSIAAIFNKLPVTDQSLAVESSICSIAYLLLVEESLRKEARKIGFRAALLSRKACKASECFDKVADLLVGRIDQDGPIQELDSDEDSEAGKQFDSTIYQPSIKKARIDTISEGSISHGYSRQNYCFRRTSQIL